MDGEQSSGSSVCYKHVIVKDVVNNKDVILRQALQQVTLRAVRCVDTVPGGGQKWPLPCLFVAVAVGGHGRGWPWP